MSIFSRTMYESKELRTRLIISLYEDFVNIDKPQNESKDQHCVIDLNIELSQFETTFWF